MVAAAAAALQRGVPVVAGANGLRVGITVFLRDGAESTLISSGRGIIGPPSNGWFATQKGR